MAVALLLTGDLAGGDLVEELLGAVGHRGRRDLRRADPLLPVEQVLVEGRREGLLLGAQLLVLPQRLLQAVPAGPLLAVLQAVLADVDLRVDVAEGLRDGLGALPADTGVGVRLLRGLDVTGGDGVREDLDLRQRLVGLRLDVGAVGGDGLVHLRAALGHLAAADLDLLPDAVALHAGLAGDLVRTGLDLGGDGGLGARADVLALGDDAVVREQDVDLGDLGALVLHGQLDVPGRQLRLRDLAGVVLGDDLDGALALAVALLGAARDSGQSGHGGGSGDDGETNGSHAGST